MPYQIVTIMLVVVLVVNPVTITLEFTFIAAFYIVHEYICDPV